VSLKLPYRKIPDGKGGYGYYAALAINIALLQKNAPRSKRFEAIIDSGASRCIFHADIGRAIGLNISSGAVETTLGVAGPTNTYLHDVCLYIPGGLLSYVQVFPGICQSLACWECKAFLTSSK
jgi:hypothetical protein